jgi:hypothetical protein
MSDEQILEDLVKEVSVRLKSMDEPEKSAMSFVKKLDWNNDFFSDMFSNAIEEESSILLGDDD